MYQHYYIYKWRNVYVTLLCQGFYLKRKENHTDYHKNPKILDTWAQLFKTNDVVSYRDVKTSNISYIKTLPFFAEKMCKSSSHFFSKKY